MSDRAMRNDAGATAVEYAIMASLIAVVIVLAVMAVGRSTADSFDCVGDKLSTPTLNC